MQNYIYVTNYKDPTIHEGEKTPMITKTHALFNLGILPSCIFVKILHVCDILGADAGVPLM